ncbi:MAG TPA: GMC family oxidoreductase [Pseudomonadales bacterium]|nr:GMC family oxidoreductase [Pseudomonadales bacterium]
MSSAFDVIVVGSGAGGAAAASQLASVGVRVLLLEKGKRLPMDGSTLDVRKVVHDGRFKSREVWRDGRGRALVPEEYFNLGGKTKWYGAALFRFGRHEFAADAHHQALGWPISYDDYAPYYERAERRLDVKTFDCEADLADILDRVERRSQWQHAPMPMGLARTIRLNSIEARHFDGFASIKRLKSDAETAFLSNAERLTIRTDANVVDLVGARDDARQIVGVRLADGETLLANHVVLAAGALHSPRLLARHLRAAKLDSSLPAAATVGRNLKLHLLTAVLAFSTSRKTDLIRKTTVLTHPAVPHSSVQPLGFDGEMLGTLIPGFVPRKIADALGQRAYGFFLQTEDGSHADNRVEPGVDGAPSRFDYDAARTPAALSEHRRLVRNFVASLMRAGYPAASKRIGRGGTAHACGTLVTGSDPHRSVVDPSGRVHGMQGLYVADGSVLPRSSRVNPSLTIYAWGLRLAELLAASIHANGRSAAVGTEAEHEAAH